MAIEDGQLIAEEWKGTIVETAQPVVDLNGYSEKVTSADVINISTLILLINIYYNFRAMILLNNTTKP